MIVRAGPTKKAAELINNRGKYDVSEETHSVEATMTPEGQIVHPEGKDVTHRRVSGLEPTTMAAGLKALMRTSLGREYLGRDLTDDEKGLATLLYKEMWAMHFEDVERNYGARTTQDE